MGSTIAARRLLAVALVLPGLTAAPARAGDGEEGERTDARHRVVCTHGAVATMRLRAEKGRIRIDLELERRTRPGPWSIVVLHERRTIALASLRSADLEGQLELRRTVPDWFGTDTIVIRASGPRGEICRTAATVD